MLRDLDRNQNLKHSGHEKDKTEKSSSDADPAGECVHVQAGMIHDTCPGWGWSYYPVTFFHLRCPSKYSWLQPRGVTADCMAGPKTKPMVCKDQVSKINLGEAHLEQGEYGELSASLLFEGCSRHISSARCLRNTCWSAATIALKLLPS